MFRRSGLRFADKNMRKRIGGAGRSALVGDMRILSVILAVIALLCAAAGPAAAGAKDETIEEWIPLPKEIGEWRKMMADRGFSFQINWVGDTIGNATGGTNRTVIHQGRFDFEGDLDFEKILGWNGLKAHANVFSIYGHGLTHTTILNFATISEIEAL